MAQETRATNAQRRTAEEKREAMIRKVTALWATADHPNTPPEEADAARKLATELMARYQIDEMVLSSTGRIVDDLIFAEIRIENYDHRLPVSDERMGLINGIAKCFDCRGVVIRRPNATADVVTGHPIAGGEFYQCIGYRMDVEMVKTLYVTLVLDLLEAMMAEKQKDKNYQRSFAMGYADRIYDRLMAVHRRVDEIAQATSNSMALAVRDKRTQVSEYFDQLHPPKSLSNVRHRQFRYDENAGQRGKNRADQADIGQKKMGEGKRKELS